MSEFQIPVDATQPIDFSTSEMAIRALAKISAHPLPESPLVDVGHSELQKMGDALGFLK